MSWLRCDSLDFLFRIHSFYWQYYTGKILPFNDEYWYDIKFWGLYFVELSTLISVADNQIITKDVSCHRRYLRNRMRSNHCFGTTISKNTAHFYVLDCIQQYVLEGESLTDCLISSANICKHNYAVIS